MCSQTSGHCTNWKARYHVSNSWCKTFLAQNTEKDVQKRNVFREISFPFDRIWTNTHTQENWHHASMKLCIVRDSDVPFAYYYFIKQVVQLKYLYAFILVLSFSAHYSILFTLSGQNYSYFCSFGGWLFTSYFTWYLHLESLLYYCVAFALWINLVYFLIFGHQNTHIQCVLFDTKHGKRISVSTKSKTKMPSTKSCLHSQ